MPRKSARVVYVPCTHDEVLRRPIPTLYGNDGDRMESCTALVEHRDGRLEILRWAELRPFEVLAAVTCPSPW